MLEVYDKTPILVPMDIMDYVVELVAHELKGRSVPGGTDSEALQGYLLKSVMTSKDFLSVLKLFLTV